MWGLDAHWKQLRQEMPQLRELPSTYLKRQMFYTTQPIEEPGSPKDLIQTYAQIGGETQIMFSSDSPHWDFDNPFVILPGSTAADLKRRILRDNAMAL
jgi:predicted TIM-barrel fold metal-dependent hydrolase